MDRSVRWILYRTGKWHAWKRGLRNSECGLVDADALAGAVEAVEEGEAPGEWSETCTPCARKVGFPLSDDLSSEERAWAGVIRRRCTRDRVALDPPDVEEFSRRLAAVGAPTDPEAVEVFDHVASLLLRPLQVRKRGGGTVSVLSGFREALDTIPPDPKRMRHVAESARVWRRITGRSFARDKFKPTRVIRTMLEVPDPEPYVQHLADKVPHFAGMFHPNTLERAKRERRGSVRGVFSGTKEYWDDEVASNIDVVTE